MIITFEKNFKPHLMVDKDREPMTHVYLDSDGWLVASDGFGLVAIPCTIKVEEDEELAETFKHSLYIPPDVVKAAQMSKLKVPAIIQTNGSDRAIATVTETARLGDDLILGDPDKALGIWRELVPPIELVCDVNHLTYDANILLRMRKAMGVTDSIMQTMLRPTSQAGHPALFHRTTFEERASFGVVMPQHPNIRHMEVNLQYIEHVRNRESPDVLVKADS